MFFSDHRKTFILWLRSLYAEGKIEKKEVLVFFKTESESDKDLSLSLIKGLFYGSKGRRNLGGGSFNRELKVVALFLKAKGDWKATSHRYRDLFCFSSLRNFRDIGSKFQIAALFRNI